MESKISIGQIFRYSSQHSFTDEEVDGYPSWIGFTAGDGKGKKLLMEAGINTPAKAKTPDGERLCCIVISSNPEKAGSVDTPWQDQFEVDNGYIKYFGDNKRPGVAPETVRGNSQLLDIFDLYTSTDLTERMSATPLIFMRNAKIAGKRKGYREFMGFGLITAVHRISQNQKAGGVYTNYVFECAVLSMSNESETFDWRWIEDRRNPLLTDKETLKFAPSSWKQWIKHGFNSVDRLKRRVATQKVINTSEQKVAKGSAEYRVLKETYDFYESKKTRFECLAALVAERVLGGRKAGYYPGWVTSPSNDKGADFIGLLKIGGSQFGAANLIVLGQAKCEKLDRPTGGNHIARTVSRLKRGWVGVYVTTSYFSENVQYEVIEDGYPIVLINGKRIALTLLELANEKGIGITELLKWIDDQYEDMRSSRRPEELLLD